MKIKLLLTSFFVCILFSGCDVSQGLTSAYNTTQCKYSYKSITGLTISGMNLSNGISPLYIPRITSILSGNANSIPLNFTINMNVNNPNKSQAVLNGLQYIISIDNVQFTTGRVNQTLSIKSGETQVLPLTIGVDVATLMKGESKSAVQNITKNFVGVGSQKSKVTVQLKPSFMIGGQSVSSPVYIPVSFSFGGK